MWDIKFLLLISQKQTLYISRIIFQIFFSQVRGLLFLPWMIKWSSWFISFRGAFHQRVAGAPSTIIEKGKITAIMNEVMRNYDAFARTLAIFITRVVYLPTAGGKFTDSAGPTLTSMRQLNCSKMSADSGATPSTRLNPFVSSRHQAPDVTTRINSIPCEMMEEERPARRAERRSMFSANDVKYLQEHHPVSSRLKSVVSLDNIINLWVLAHTGYEQVTRARVLFKSRRASSKGWVSSLGARSDGIRAA